MNLTNIETIIADNSQVTVIFDEKSPNFCKNHPEYNQMFLKAQQNYFNDLLRVRGHVFLNEVYDGLGLPRTSRGAICGWILDAENKGSFIDFKPVEDENGAIMLPIAVDGVIFDKIGDQDG